MSFKVKIFLSMGNRFSQTLSLKHFVFKDRGKLSAPEIFSMQTTFVSISIWFRFVYGAFLHQLCLDDQDRRHVVLNLELDLFQRFCQDLSQPVWENPCYVGKILLAFHLLDIKHPSWHSLGCTIATKKLLPSALLMFLCASRLDLQTQQLGYPANITCL